MDEVQSYKWWLNWLKTERKKYLSENRMAQAVGIPQPTLNRILSGKSSGIKFFKLQMASENK